MPEHDWLSERFEGERSHLRAVAYRMLGSLSEADDAVQEAWLRLSRTDTRDVDNFRGWLTTVVARLCLDALRARKARREESSVGDDEGRSGDDGVDPEQLASLADSVGVALLVVLDTLTPTERVAFVLHDLFDLSFDDIAPIVGRSPAAARQLASRARRRVERRGPAPDSDLARKREVVEAFLAASRAGDLEPLLALLAPDVVLRADDVAIDVAAANAARGARGLAKMLRGGRAVAETFKGRAHGAVPALVDGAPGAVWSQGDATRAVFAFAIVAGKIVAIDLIMDPAHIRQLKIER
jgi:RNA polymerase sigma-70 factor (ECF subfamily)